MNGWSLGNLRFVRIVPRLLALFQTGDRPVLFTNSSKFRSSLREVLFREFTRNSNHVNFFQHGALLCSIILEVLFPPRPRLEVKPRFRFLLESLSYDVLLLLFLYCRRLLILEFRNSFLCKKRRENLI